MFKLIVALLVLLVLLKLLLFRSNGSYINVRAYTRRLPIGFHASGRARMNAMKFGILLDGSHTFVSSYLRRK